MQPDQMILPAIATAALGTALLVPLRDGRPGNRATIRDVTLPSLLAVLQSFVRRTWAYFASPVQNERQSPDEPNARDQTTLVERSFAAELDALVPFVHGPVADNGRREAPAITPAVAPCAIPPAIVEEDCRDTHDAQRDVAVHDVPPLHVPFERIVPITRMPLRRHALAVTWTSLVPHGTPLATEPERHAYLRRLANEPDDTLEPLLIAAYREEDARGRVLALAALRNGGCRGTFDVLRDALAVGTDEERSFAVDALLAMDRSDAVTSAFADRVDAIAAQAALGFVWSHRRADFYTALGPYVDRARIDTILGLLAGVLE